jgi:hypothetical protein
LHVKYLDIGALERSDGSVVVIFTTRDVTATITELGLQLGNFGVQGVDLSLSDLNNTILTIYIRTESLRRTSSALAEEAALDEDALELPSLIPPVRAWCPPPDIAPLLSMRSPEYN